LGHLIKDRNFSESKKRKIVYKDSYSNLGSPDIIVRAPPEEEANSSENFQNVMNRSIIGNFSQTKPKDKLKLKVKKTNFQEFVV
jgi:hypothetical protein